MFSSSEMISSLDKLRLRLHWLISSSVLVSSLSPLFPTIILVTTTAWTCLLRDNSNQRNSARNLVLMISSLPTKFSILNLLRSTTKSSLSTFHTLVTLRKLWMSIALRFSSVDNRLTCSTMSAKIPYSLLPWFSIWSFWPNYSAELNTKLKAWELSKNSTESSLLSATCARLPWLIRTPPWLTLSSDKKLP